ncbi:MAG: anaerobic ribonucleoside-triphosphate reductase activating protein [Desulfatiglandaceae bacterium]
MIFGGLQKNSLIDYPGKVSCVIFASGCNFRCPYCHNPELVKGDDGGSARSNKNGIYDFLERRKGLLDGVVISGGEPTLQRNLIRVCDRIKKMGYPVKLDTNGSRPATVKRLIEDNLIDYIAMDIKTDPFHYSPLFKEDCNPKNILSCVEIIMGASIGYEFRTTCVRPIVNAKTVIDIVKIIKGAQLYALQRFHPGQVLDPRYFNCAEATYNDSEMINLRTLAAPWVQACIVR